MNCVPFNSARPSFEHRVMGLHPILFIIVSPSTTSPSISTSPNPSRGKHIWARGERSPDAPNEPCSYTTGIMLLLNISTRRSTVTSCTPEWPYESDCTFRRSIRRAISDGTRWPVPHACDIIRFFCSCERFSLSTEILHKEPNPVVTPYIGFFVSSIFLSRYSRQ